MIILKNLLFFSFPFFMMRPDFSLPTVEFTPNTNFSLSSPPHRSLPHHSPPRPPRFLCLFPPYSLIPNRAPTQQRRRAASVSFSKRSSHRIRNCRPPRGARRAAINVSILSYKKTECIIPRNKKTSASPPPATKNGEARKPPRNYHELPHAILRSFSTPRGRAVFRTGCP